jgi:UDP-glucose 4-epimerase
MTILVTGGAGYIGSHFVLRLKEQKQNVVVYDNLSTGHARLVKESNLIQADVRDEETLVKVMREHGVTAVVHFAASCYVGESVTDPAKYYNNNVYGSLVLLQAMVRAGVKKIVFSSSCATYGLGSGRPITEETEQLPINPYGATKLMTERMLADFSSAHGINYTVLRYFNAAGADLHQRTGELHEPETHLIPLVLQVAKGIHQSVNILGTDYETPDGTCIRDYVHVLDIAEAHLLALLHMDDGKSRGCFNIGSETGFSVREVVAACSRVTGRAIKTVESARRPGDPPVLVATAEKIRRQLGWTQQYSSLDKIIESAWRWEQIN